MFAARSTRAEQIRFSAGIVFFPVPLRFVHNFAAAPNFKSGGMKYHRLKDVPLAKLRKWLATAERAFGPTCPTARIYRTEIRRRVQLERRARKAVRHVR